MRRSGLIYRDQRYGFTYIEICLGETKKWGYLMKLASDDFGATLDWFLLV